MMKNKKIAIIGVGYVGVTLLQAYAERGFSIVGYDISKSRVKNLISNYKYDNVIFTSNKSFLKGCDYYFICVNTGFDRNGPEITDILNVTEVVIKKIKKGSCIIYESTLLPGTINKILIPKINELTKYKINIDFYIGFSPERINPGDEINGIGNIKKIISCDNETGIINIKEIYSHIYPINNLVVAKSILHAEFSKVIENTQRYINIQFINELSISLDKYGINIYDILDLCGTKWNFLKFKPGFVSGSCIPLALKYLEYSFKENGNNNSLISISELIQDDFDKFITEKINNIIKSSTKKTKVLFLGITYKKNVSNFSLNYYYKIYNELIKNNKKVYIYDPYINSNNIKNLLQYGFERKSILKKLEGKYDIVCYFIDHEKFSKNNFRLNIKDGGYFFDITGRFSDKDFNNFVSI